MFLGEPRRSRFPSVLLQPLGHLSVFKINNLRVDFRRLSHTSAFFLACCSLFAEPPVRTRRRSRCQRKPRHFRNHDFWATTDEGLVTRGARGVGPNLRLCPTGCTERLVISACPPVARRSGALSPAGSHPSRCCCRLRAVWYRCWPFRAAWSRARSGTGW